MKSITNIFKNKIVDCGHMFCNCNDNRIYHCTVKEP